MCAGVYETTTGKDKRWKIYSAGCICLFQLSCLAGFTYGSLESVCADEQWLVLCTDNFLVPNFKIPDVSFK